MSAPIQGIPATLVTTYLQMTDPDQFRPAFLEAAAGIIRQMTPPDIPLYRFLYAEVGAGWRWRDRLLLSDAELYDALAQPTTAVYVLYVEHEPAGYVELVRQGDDTEIAYFGLRPPYMGCGYGKHLLSWGIAQAWADGARRVWLHTCNLDAPQALNNYLKRGFSVFHVEEKPMPARYT